MSATISREEYAPYIYRTLLHEGRVHLYEFETMMPEHVDRFFDRFEPILHNWDSNQRYLMVYDLSHLEVSYSPYFKKRVFEAIPIFIERNIHGKRAVVLRKNVVGRIINAFSKDIQFRTNQHILAQTFFNQAEALEWVTEELK